MHTYLGTYVVRSDLYPAGILDSVPAPRKYHWATSVIASKNSEQHLLSEKRQCSLNCFSDSGDLYP